MKILKIINIWIFVFQFSQTSFAQKSSVNESYYSFFNRRIQLAKNSGYDDIAACFFAFSGNTIKKFIKKDKKAKDSTIDYRLFYAVSKYSKRKFDKRLSYCIKSKFKGVFIYFYAISEYSLTDFISRYEYAFKKKGLKDEFSIFFAISKYSYDKYLKRVGVLKKEFPKTWNELYYMFAASEYNILTD